MRSPGFILIGFGILVHLVGFLKAEIDCEWFGEGPICSAQCPNGWSLVLESTEGGQSENCTEDGLKKFCCNGDVYAHQNDFNSSDDGEEADNKTRFDIFKKKQYFLMKLLSNHDAGGILQEARIILPQQDNSGASLKTVRLQLEKRLIKEFGGLTRFDAQGGWMEDTRLFEEPVWVFDVACENTPENHKKLERIAKWLKKAAEQDAIYLRYPDGRVIFV